MMTGGHCPDWQSHSQHGFRDVQLKFSYREFSGQNLLKKSGNELPCSIVAPQVSFNAHLRRPFEALKLDKAGGGISHEGNEFVKAMMVPWRLPKRIPK